MSVKFSPSLKLKNAFSILCVISCMTAQTSFAQEALLPEIAAREAFLMESSTGAVLFEKEADRQAPPASMSKLMTAYVIFDAIKNKKITLDDQFTVSENARSQPGSRMFLNIGESVRVEDLLKGAIIQSGNDACVALAEGYAGDVNAFTDLMNAKAKALNLKNSSFTNVNGLPDPQHFMSARDLAILSDHIIKEFPDFYKIYSEKDFTWNNIKQGNRNPLLYAGINADGVKTGHTEEAGYGLVGSSVQNGMRLISVITGMNSMNERSSESKKLLQYGFREYRLKKIGAPGLKIADLDVRLGTTDTVPVELKETQTVLTRRGSDAISNGRLEYNAPLIAPIKKGEEVGKLTVSVPNGAERVFPVYAAADVPETGPIGKIGENIKFLLFGSQMPDFSVSDIDLKKEGE